MAEKMNFEKSYCRRYQRTASIALSNRFKEANISQLLLNRRGTGSQPRGVATATTATANTSSSSIRHAVWMIVQATIVEVLTAFITCPSEADGIRPHLTVSDSILFQETFNTFQKFMVSSHDPPSEFCSYLRVFACIYLSISVDLHPSLRDASLPIPELKVFSIGLPWLPWYTDRFQQRNRSRSPWRDKRPGFIVLSGAFIADFLDSWNTQSTNSIKFS